MVAINEYDGSLPCWKNTANHAKAGEFSTHDGRSLAWKLFLGVLPCNGGLTQWRDTLLRERCRYQNLKDQYVPDLSSSMQDPLAAHAHGDTQGVWKTYYASAELRSEIQRDLDRLFIDGIDEAFFMTKERQHMMLMILYVWASEHSDPSYRQGMHELVAIFVYVLTQDSEVYIGDASEEMKTLTDPERVEADAFLLFDSLMTQIVDWYEVKKGKSSSDPPLLVACNRIQTTLLSQVDRPLAAKMSELELSPQLYGMKWLRLLFLREFEKDDVLILWDAAFACSASFFPRQEDLATQETYFESMSDRVSATTFAESMAVSMILSVRPTIMGDDRRSGGSESLCALMKYSATQSVSRLLAKALELIRARQAGVDLAPDEANGQGNKKAQQVPSWLGGAMKFSREESLGEGASKLISSTRSTFTKTIQSASNRLKGSAASTEAPALVSPLDRVLQLLNQSLSQVDEGDLADNLKACLKNTEEVRAVLAGDKAVEECDFDLPPPQSPPQQPASNGGNTSTGGLFGESSVRPSEAAENSPASTKPKAEIDSLFTLDESPSSQPAAPAKAQSQSSTTPAQKQLRTQESNELLGSLLDLDLHDEPKSKDHLW